MLASKTAFKDLKFNVYKHERLILTLKAIDDPTSFCSVIPFDIFFSGRLRQCFLKLRPDSEPGQCDFKARYRTISGRCNNLQNPEWGSAGQTYRRLIANAYQDGKSVPRGGRHPSSLPNPRWISQKNHPDADHPDYRFTHMVMQFGQFLDHDVTLTPKDGNHYLLNVNLYKIIYLCQKKEEILSISCNLTICSFFA